MAERVGILGEASNTTVATHTVYTVPAGKAAVFKPIFLVQAGGGGATVFTLTINGIAVFSQSLAASAYGWSSTAQMIKESATFPDGLAVADVVAPAPMTYYLNAGDVVSYTLGTTAATSALVQLVGTEVDV